MALCRRLFIPCTGSRTQSRAGRSIAFYEALGFESRRELPIVRDGELEATNYFFGIPGQEEELELTFNHDGSTYELGTGYGHIALAVDDLDETLERLMEQGIEPEREPYRVREGGSRLCFVRDPDGDLRTLSRGGSVREGSMAVWDR
jgi:lactoylglutathione lyase